MRKLFIIITMTVSLLFVSGVMGAPKTSKFSTTQKKEIEGIIRSYLVTNPEVLVEASRALQQKERQRAIEQARKAIPENADKLFNSLNSQVAGNPHGNVTLVEFYDHQCRYCKQIAPLVQKLIQDDKNLRVVFKEFPIFGANSEYAAKAVLAARKQGKYVVLHEALLKEKNRLSPELVLKIAKDEGIDIKQLKRDVNDPLITKHLEENRELASALGLNGTPAFVLASYPVTKDMKFFFVPGVPSESMLQNLINKIRE